MKPILRTSCILLFGLSVVWACAFDDTLREYLNLHFWLPFAKKARDFERAGAVRLSEPFAGMGPSGGETPLANLAAAYQALPGEDDLAHFDFAKLRQALAAAQSSAPSLAARERQEVELLDAKIDLRAGSLDSARKKLIEFLRKAQNPELPSEARGWLAHVYYLSGEQTAAGKIYLDELNRNDSNLSAETVINSLRLTYGYDGGPELVKHLDEYFDTPEHAAFAIQLATNPRWTREHFEFGGRPEPVVTRAPPYARMKSLLERHADLLRTAKGAAALASLGMRTALRAGDPAAAARIAAAVPANAATRNEPDFIWMLASAHFLSRHYAAAERPLLRLFRSSHSSANQKAAAAYGLCGVYWKAGNTVERTRFALWLHAQVRKNEMYLASPSIVEDQSVYWAVSGWDLALLLDAEASIQALRSFIGKYPHVPDVRLVKYSLAVRLARENRYEEAARMYEAVNANPRASRMRQLAPLYADANQLDEATYKMAEYIGANPEKIYFNDELWSGLQRYALFAAKDGRLTRDERRRQIRLERKFKDDQEERWRAYLLLRGVVRRSGGTDVGRKAARLAIRDLRGISERFGRVGEIRAADVELSRWLNVHRMTLTDKLR
ncbi:MAG: hypothetical protein M3Y07_04045 [Acidobacteriota bacterium]|nr:hypothetical protein [Acidobacteriota bacterium]